MTKEEKKALLQQWNAEQEKKYILDEAQVEDLFGYLEEKLEACDCDHTLKFTLEWLKKHYPGDEAKMEEIIHELNEDGGYCDCEVLMNCYEDYDLE